MAPTSRVALANFRAAAAADASEALAKSVQRYIERPRNLQLNGAQLREAMTELARRGSTDDAMALFYAQVNLGFAQVGGRRWHADDETAILACKLLIAGGQWERACFLLIEDLPVGEWWPGARVYDFVLQQAPAEHWGTALQLAHLMKLRALQWSNNTYDSLIAVCGRAGKYQLVLEIFKHLQEPPPAPSRWMDFFERVPLSVAGTLNIEGPPFIGREPSAADNAADAPGPGTSYPPQVLVGNLDRHAHEGELLSLLSQFGFPLTLFILRDAKTRVSRCIASVQFPTHAQADAAIAGLSGTQLRSRQLRLYYGHKTMLPKRVRFGLPTYTVLMRALNKCNKAHLVASVFAQYMSQGGRLQIEMCEEALQSCVDGHVDEGGRQLWRQMQIQGVLASGRVCEHVALLCARHEEQLHANGSAGRDELAAGSWGWREAMRIVCSSNSNLPVRAFHWAAVACQHAGKPAHLLRIRGYMEAAGATEDEDTTELFERAAAELASSGESQAADDPQVVYGAPVPMLPGWREDLSRSEIPFCVPCHDDDIQFVLSPAFSVV